MPAKVILNPYSNRWRSRERWPEAEAGLRAAGLNFEVVVSQHKGHCLSLAEQAVREGCSPIIAAGGDGTIGEVVNGMMNAGAENDGPIGPLGVIPLGSANDFAYSINIPLELSEAAKVIVSGKTKLVDVGKVNDRYFVNNAGIGLEPYVTIKHEKIKYIRGILRYLVAAVQAIWEKPQWDAVLEWDDGKYDGKISLVSIGNGARTGGFYMTPHAILTDGLLTFTYAYRSTRRSMFATLPRAMKPGPGNYVEMEDVFEVNASRLSIKLQTPSPAHADGELFPEWVRELDFSIFPALLSVTVSS